MDYYYSVVYLVFGIFALSFSILINNLLLRFSKNLGMRDLDENMVRWASAQKPALGGISFYILFLVSLIFYFTFFNAETFFHNYQLTGILLSVSIGFLMGLADDAYNTRPGLKFGAQILCGLILIFTGTSIRLFDSEILNYLLTLFWVTGIMNSINMLDNMDSITTNVSIFIILSCLLVSVQKHPVTEIYFVMMLGVIIALFGFLYFNWHPSKMFMGDTGSQFLGVFLAAMGIIYLWNPAPDEPINFSKQVIAIGLAFILPLADTTTVTINRLAKGRSPFVGGRDHTTHFLSYLGLSDRQVALVFIVISVISVFLNLIIHYKIKSWNHGLTLGFSLYILIVFLVLFIITRRVKPKN